MTESQSTLVLGGGVGGVVAAVELRKQLSSRHRVVLVDRREQHLFEPSLLWLMTGDRSASAISRPLASLRKKGIEVVHGTVEHIDCENRRATVSGEELSADRIVISLGAELAPERIPGLADAGFNLYTLAGAKRLSVALRNFQQGRVVVLTAAPAYKCPAAPYEAAMLLEYYFRKNQVRGRVLVDLYAAEAGPMGVTGKDNSAAVRRMVEQKGIGFYPEHQVESVDPKANRISFTNGAHADFDLLVYVPPHRAPTVLHESGLVGDSGWISVHRETLATEHDGIYAVGDATSITLKVGKPLPMAGVFAHGQAQVVAQNIARDINKKGRSARYNGHGMCFLEAGDGKAGLGRGNFYAEPTPKVKLHRVGRHWHAAKVLFEKSWFARWL
jgi:sulfide:quinone oxidoreductase